MRHCAGDIVEMPGCTGRCWLKRRLTRFAGFELACWNCAISMSNRG